MGAGVGSRCWPQRKGGHDQPGGHGIGVGVWGTGMGEQVWGAGGGEHVWGAGVDLKGGEVMINQEDTVCVLT